jgi:hypothetical protein
VLATYLDESRSIGDNYFIGALIVDQSALRQIELGFDHLAQMVAAANVGVSPKIELHGYEMFHGKEDWDRVSLAWRVKASRLAVRIVANAGGRHILRGINIPALRAKYKDPFPVHELTLSHCLAEVDRQIEKHYAATELSLVLADEHHTAPDSRSRFSSMRIALNPGWNSERVITRLVDSIYFGPSKESRLLQAADILTFFENRWRTSRESDPRAHQAMTKIRADLDRSRLHAYLWSPDR